MMRLISRPFPKCVRQSRSQTAAFGTVKGVVMPHGLRTEKTVEEKRTVRGEETIYKLGKHRSNAMELVNNVPVIEVDGEKAICDGGGGALGHPLQYISLERPNVVEVCKYCNLRFTQKKHH